MKVKSLKFIWQFLLVCIFVFLLLWLDKNPSIAGVKSQSVKVIPCDSAKNVVKVSTKKVTALSFLENPKELVPGDASFDFKRVQNEIFVKSLSLSAKTNMFVFVGNKRCRFNLVTNEQNPDELLEIREPLENVMEVKFNED